MGYIKKKGFYPCAQGRIEGAILKGNTWLIPENAEKPDDPRRVRKNGQDK